MVLGKERVAGSQGPLTDVEGNDCAYKRLKQINTMVVDPIVDSASTEGEREEEDQSIENEEGDYVAQLETQVDLTSSSNVSPCRVMPTRGSSTPLLRPVNIKKENHAGPKKLDVEERRHYMFPVTEIPICQSHYFFTSTSTRGTN